MKNPGKSLMAAFAVAAASGLPTDAFIAAVDKLGRQPLDPRPPRTVSDVQALLKAQQKRDRKNAKRLKGIKP